MDDRPWFESDDYEHAPAYLAMSEADRARVTQFREQGYLVIEDTGICEATIDDAVAKLGRKYKSLSTGYEDTGRLHDGWRGIASVRDIALAPTIARTLELLYQRDPIPFQTLNFERPTQQRAHSDTVHFNTLPHGFMCGVWVALEDVDTDNGPLFYHPGSQRLPVFHMHDLGLTPGVASYPAYENAIERKLAESPYAERGRALLKKGQALVWCSNIFHGGSTQMDPARTRRSQVTHFYFPGCVYYTPLLSPPERGRWQLRTVEDIRDGSLHPRASLLETVRARAKSAVSRLALRF